MFKNRFVSFDCEYGGVNSRGVFSSEYSILEVSLEIWDENFEVLESLDLKIKPENEVYKVSRGGLEANGIDLIEHDKKSMTEGQAKDALYKFLKKHSEDGKIKLVPAGVGVSGDIRYLTEHKFIAQTNWERFCSHQILDVAQLAFWLKVLKRMPQTRKPTGEISNSLEALAYHFGVPIKGLHSAKGDVELFRQVCLAMGKFLKKYMPEVKPSI